jgi:predicted CoA-substrate-specific enzyme activase
LKGYFLGIDVGSVTTKLVITDINGNINNKIYLRTQGKPMEAIIKGLSYIKSKGNVKDSDIIQVGTTGSGRNLAGVMVGADTIKNEITAHSKACIHIKPDVKTIIEIGGQDSKIILINDGIIRDFAMNTVCAAGTGSFLDRQGERLNIPIEDFGVMALQSNNPVRIAGRCAVFAESDMIHKQQMGHSTEDIIMGLCFSLARNYLNNVGKGKKIESPIVFQGGVAANKGIVKAFSTFLESEIIVPENHDVLGALGAALLAKDNYLKGEKTKFKGFDIINSVFKTKSFECKDCSNLCEIVTIYQEDKLIACWNSKCGQWTEESPKLDRTLYVC